jgi:hypothetical protein
MFGGLRRRDIARSISAASDCGRVWATSSTRCRAARRAVSLPGSYGFGVRRRVRHARCRRGGHARRRWWFCAAWAARWRNLRRMPNCPDVRSTHFAASFVGVEHPLRSTPCVFDGGGFAITFSTGLSAARCPCARPFPRRWTARRVRRSVPFQCLLNKHTHANAAHRRGCYSIRPGSVCQSRRPGVPKKMARGRCRSVSASRALWRVERRRPERVRQQEGRCGARRPRR